MDALGVAAAHCRTEEPQARLARPQLPMRPLAAGLLAALGLLAFYLGVITLAQGWPHALQQLAEDRWFVGAIAVGFGTQVGLFAYLRGLHARLTSGGVAASTGTSTAAMLACCAHHLTEVVPLLGISGAAIFLNAYRVPLLWLGVTLNAAGVAYMMLRLRRFRSSESSAPPSQPLSQEVTSYP